ncbi:3-dehydroquinate synthase [Blastomonas natatoria]|uniref:3-dehydroquinate synthase n=1 Tax=Blastomonas natatoria TaxID=34015 RepID=A0A2V3UPP9_9SPHN|nr:3-dehydroquinate synthase [Blastomonas natatoria]PXW68475.1 3-dehydroquinate synthase [Blastomonas natatoria]
MARVNIALGQRSYDILVQAGALGSIVEHIKPWVQRGRTLWVSDSQVAAHHWDGIAVQLAEAGIEAHLHVVPAGEASKSWAELSRLIDWLLTWGVERSDTIFALGGGMIGDLTGFAASIVKRGCEFVQVPTTLLAQVDSSVGGKTAINTTAGKNLVGTFHQPRFVLIDPEVLATLPPREMRAGYAEVVKYGLIDDAAFFDWCETHGQQVLAQDSAALEHAIVTSVSAKARIVGEDERETRDRRALLNLGHTFGHALEADTGFGERLLHGEAVGVGMILALQYSARRGDCDAADAARVAAHFAACSMPTTLQDTGVSSEGAALVDHMRHDKKMTGGTLPFLLLTGIGQTYVAHDVDLDDVARFLDERHRSAAPAAVL